jgi:hypothetical protein
MKIANEVIQFVIDELLSKTLYEHLNQQFAQLMTQSAQTSLLQKVETQTAERSLAAGVIFAHLNTLVKQTTTQVMGAQQSQEQN